MVGNARQTRGARLVVLAVGLATGLVTATIVGRSPDPALPVPVELAVGWLLLATAVVAVGRPGRRPFGVAVAAASVAWFVAEWNQPAAGSAWSFTAGLIFATVGPVLVAEAALRYPSGGRGSRATVVAYLCTAGLAGLVPALFFDPAATGCGDCPANLVLIRAWPSVAEAAGRASVYAGAGWVLLLAGVLGWRLVRAPETRRRLGAPVVVPAIADLGVVGLTYLTSWGESYPGEDFRAVEAGLLVLLVLGAGWSYVRRRRTRTAVARMVVEASGIATAGGLDRSLGAALGDDSLRVLYPLGDGRWIDEAGRRVDPEDGRRTTRLTRGDTTIALLVHRREVLDEDGVLDEITGTAGLALDHERLQAQRQAQLSDLRASRARIVATADAERRRLERDLHDGAQQHIVALSLAIRLAQLRHGEEQLRRGEDQLRRGEDQLRRGGDPLDQAQAEVTAALAELRTLARGLYPRELADEGLAAALESLAESSPIPVTVDAPLGERLPPPVEEAAYFAVAYRLAGAAAVQATVSVRRDHDRVRIEIEDDGPPGDTLSIEDRIVALAGTLSVEPVRPAGTRIRAELPCGS